MSLIDVHVPAYPMRTHISKVLKTRCTAIQHALAYDNKAAASLDPPRAPLDWATVGGYQFLEEFALLADTRNDIRHKRWAESAVRAVMKQRHCIRRAYEEIERLNVETRRLHTAIRDQHLLFRDTRARLKASNDFFYGAVEDFMVRRENINQQLLRRIQEIHSLPGYTGSKTCVVRQGMEDRAPLDAVPVGENPAADDNVDIFEGDEQQQALGNVVEFISSLSL